MFGLEFVGTGFYICLYVLVVFTGLAVGSFLNVVIYRLPEGQSLINGASHCRSCGKVIRAQDNIPVLGWLMLRGKCYNCGEKISSRYPIVEALNCLVYVFTFTYFNMGINPLAPDDFIYMRLIKSIIFCVFFSVLIVISFVDWDHLEIDVPLFFAIAVLCVPAAIWVDEITIYQRILGFFAVSLPFFIIGEVVGAFIKKQTGVKIRAIELGDTILMAVTGFLIGYRCITVSAFFGIVIAALFGIVYKKITKKSKFAFGPNLCVGIFIGSFWGDDMINWYVNLLTE
ncbi:MAG: prepilin peptidase [Ruminococcus sp.]|jgi:leader peptidase (prepilin peptidase)/N-methyltransferase|nr:prepilin peptidase [Ruminococcus sp.]